VLLTVLKKILTLRPVLLNFITMSDALNHCIPSVLWHCWLGDRNGIWQYYLACR